MLHQLGSVAEKLGFVAERNLQVLVLVLVVEAGLSCLEQKLDFGCGDL